MNNRDDHKVSKGLIPSRNRAGMQQQLLFEDAGMAQHIVAHKPKLKIIKIIGIVSIVSAISIFAVAAVISYKYSAKPHSLDEIRLIHKDLNPVKVEPIEPGGERFSNQDITVYEAIEKDHATLSANKKMQLEELAKVAGAAKDASKTKPVEKIEPKEAAKAVIKEEPVAEPEKTTAKNIDNKNTIKKAKAKPIKEPAKQKQSPKAAPSKKVDTNKKADANKKNKTTNEPKTNPKDQPGPIKDVFDLAG